MVKGGNSMVLLLTVFIVFIVMLIIFLIAAVKNARIKPTICPACEREVKLVIDNQKCPKCRTKLFKHSNGEYQIRT